MGVLDSAVGLLAPGGASTFAGGPGEPRRHRRLPAGSRRTPARCVRSSPSRSRGPAAGGPCSDPETPRSLPRGGHSGPHRRVLLSRNGADPGRPDGDRHVAALSRTPPAARLPERAPEPLGGGEMTCNSFVRAIDAYLDDELPVMDILRLYGHLLSCGHCHRVMGSEAALHSLLAEEAARDQPSGALRERILQRVAAEEQVGPSGTPAGKA